MSGETVVTTTMTPRRRPGRMTLVVVAALLAGGWSGITGATARAVGGGATATATATATKSLLQVGGAPTTVAVTAAGGGREVLMAGAAGQTITLTVADSTFTGPCAVSLAVSTAAGAALLPPTCGGSAGALPPIAVTGTSLLHLHVQAAPGETGSLVVRATGTGAQSLTPNAPPLQITAPARRRSVLVLPANAGDRMVVAFTATGGSASLGRMTARVIRHGKQVSRIYRFGGPTYSFSMPVTEGGELRLWLLNRGDVPISLMVGVRWSNPRRGTLTEGVPVTVPLRVGGQVTDLSYTSVPGTAPVLQLRVSGEPTVKELGLLSVYDDDDNQVIFVPLTRQRRLLALPVGNGGTYRVSVFPDSDADGKVVLTLGPPLAHQDITLGQPATVPFDGSGAPAVLNLAVKRGQLLSLAADSFDVTTEQGEVAAVTVSSGDDAPAVWGEFTGDDILDATVLPPAGWVSRWRITLAAPPGATGSLVVTAHDEQVTPVSSALGEATAVSLTRGRPYADVVVPAAAGDRLAAAVSGLTFTGGTGGMLRVHRSEAGVLGQRYQGRLTADGALHFLHPLPAAGLVTVRFSLFGHASAATATVTIIRSRVASHTLVPWTDTTVDLNAAVQRYTFHVDTGNIVSFTVRGATDDHIAMSLVQPRGQRVIRWVGADRSTTFISRVTGTDTVTLIGGGTVVLSVGVATPKQLPPLMDGVPTPVVVTPADSVVVLPLPTRASPQQGYDLAFTDVSSDDITARLLDRAGHQVGGELSINNGRDFPFLYSELPTVGPYRIEIIGGHPYTLTVTARLDKPLNRMLTPGAATTVRVTEFGHRIRLLIHATAGQTLTWNVSLSRWKLGIQSRVPTLVVTAPDGSVVTSAPAAPGAGPPVDVTSTGTWALSLDVRVLKGALTLTPSLTT